MQCFMHNQRYPQYNTLLCTNNNIDVGFPTFINKIFIEFEHCLGLTLIIIYISLINYTYITIDKLSYFYFQRVCILYTPSIVYIRQS